MTIILPEWVVIGAEPWATPAIVHEDLVPLRGVSLRGSNIKIPGVSGMIRTPRRSDELDVVMKWFVNGFRDPDNAPYADHLDGLETNLEHYRSLLLDGRSPLTGEVDAEIHLVGRTLVGTVQPIAWDPVRTGPATATVLSRLIVPADGWEEAGP